METLKKLKKIKEVLLENVRIKAVKDAIEDHFYYLEMYKIDFDEDKLADELSDLSIIGSYRAMQYLLENDHTLLDSVDLAVDHGCKIEDMNSELLANLLFQTKISDDLSFALQELENVDFDDEEEV